MQQNWYIHTGEHYAAERKKELLPFATAWMGVENIILTIILYFSSSNEKRETDRERPQCPVKGKRRLPITRCGSRPRKQQTQVSYVALAICGPRADGDGNPRGTGAVCGLLLVCDTWLSMDLRCAFLPPHPIRTWGEP